MEPSIWFLVPTQRVAGAAVEIALVRLTPFSLGAQKTIKDVQGVAVEMENCSWVEKYQKVLTNWNCITTPWAHME